MSRSGRSPRQAPPSGAAPPTRRWFPRWPWWRLLLVAVVAGVLSLAYPLASWWADRQRRHDVALSLARNGNPADAIPSLQRALEDDPNDADLLGELAIAELKSGALLTNVEPLLTRWCELRPKDAAPWKLRMDVRSRLGNAVGALEDGRHVLTLSPDDAEVRELVAELLLASGNFAEAEAECRRCLDARPDRRPPLLYLLAKVYKADDKPDRAAAVLDELLRDRPDFTPAVVLRGTLLVEAEQFDRAVAVLEPALGQDPSYRQAVLYQLGTALVRSGQGERGRRLLDEMRQLQDADRLLKDVGQQPDNLDLKVRAAEALLRVGRRDEARGLLDQVLARDAQNAAARRLLDRTAP